MNDFFGNPPDAYEPASISDEMRSRISEYLAVHWNELFPAGYTIAGLRDAVGDDSAFPLDNAGSLEDLASAIEEDEAVLLAVNTSALRNEVSPTMTTEVDGFVVLFGLDYDAAGVVSGGMIGELRPQQEPVCHRVDAKQLTAAFLDTGGFYATIPL